MEVECEWCGKSFKKPKSHILRVKNVFCSGLCSQNHQKVRLQKDCKVCGSVFEIRPSEKEKFSTCSEACRKISKTGQFNPNWKGGKEKPRRVTLIDRLRKTWAYQEWRTSIFERANSCQNCGSGGSLEIHHHIPIKIMPEMALDIDNGQILCEECHKMAHKNKMHRGAKIAVDLDGTLANHYEGAFHPEKIGDPVPDMLERVNRWLKEGFNVVIFTARAEDEGNIEPIKKWLKQNGLPPLEITNRKTMDMVSIWDDRAKQVVPNEGIPVDGLEEGSKKRSFELMNQIREDIESRRKHERNNR